MLRLNSCREAAGLMAIAILGAQIIMPMSQVFATNQGTIDGNRTTGCSVNWNSQSILDKDYSGVPANLQVDLTGKSVDYSNGGYVSEVSPLFNNNLAGGKMEMQHWIQEGTPNTMNWRFFIGTERNINNAIATVDLPAGYTYTASDQSVWGATRYAPAVGGSWTTPKSATVTLEGNKATINIGNMLVNNSTTIQFTAQISPDQVNDTFMASANLTGNYNGVNIGNNDSVATNCVEVTGPTVSIKAIDCHTIAWSGVFANRETVTYYQPIVRITDENGTIIIDDLADPAGKNSSGDNLFKSLNTGEMNVEPGHTYTVDMGYLYNGKWYSKATTQKLSMMDSCLASVSGKTYHDLDNNGALNGGDANYAGKIVNLIDNNNLVIATATTDAEGNYKFDNLKPGQYTVRITSPSGRETVTTPVEVSNIALDFNKNVTDINFGFFTPAEEVIEPPVVKPTEPTTDTVVPVTGTKTVTPVSVPEVFKSTQTYQIPASLPETGSQANVSMLIIGAIASLFTYGMAYLIQNKRQ